MADEFNDHFSASAHGYSVYRPTYPDALFHYLSTLAPESATVWDCATGNGQAAVAMGKFFDKVIATDASQKQIDSAMAAQNVSYRVAAAENSGIQDNSVDLVTVAQALHWFNLEAFFDEALRVLKPNGILAFWSYELHSIEAAVDDCIQYFYAEVVGPYWPPERRMIENKFRDIGFPLKELTPPAFEMTHQWSLAQLIGYLKTWSAVSAYKKECSVDPIDLIQKELTTLWGDPEVPKRIVWPLNVRIGIKEGE